MHLYVGLFDSAKAVFQKHYSEKSLSHRTVGDSHLGKAFKKVPFKPYVIELNLSSPVLVQ